MPPAIGLREGVNEQLKTHFGVSTDGEVANRIGIDPATWSRVIRGVSLPGRKLLDLLLNIEGIEFNDITELVIHPPERQSTTRSLLTADEIAVAMHCKRRTAIRKARTGEWPAHRSGRAYLYDLDEVLQATKAKAAERPIRRVKPAHQPRARANHSPAIEAHDFEPLQARTIQRRRRSA